MMIYEVREFLISSYLLLEYHPIAIKLRFYTTH